MTTRSKRKAAIVEPKSLLEEEEERLRAYCQVSSARMLEQRHGRGAWRCGGRRGQDCIAFHASLPPTDTA